MNAPVPEGGGAAPLRRLNARLDRLACAACVVLFGAIFAIMVCQIAFRYLLNAPLVWTEELARYLYVWVCYLGAPVALRRGTHVSVSVLADRLPPALGRGVLLATQGLALVFFAALAIQGARLAARSHSVSAITLPIPWSLIYLAVPVAAVLMLLETVEAVWTRGGRPPGEARP